MKTPQGFTEKEWRFVLNYPRCKMNGTRAAILAGYAESGAPQQAQRLLKKAHVKKALEEWLAKINEDIDISAERVLQEIAKLAFANMGDYVTVQDDGTALVDFSALTPREMAAIQEISTEEYVEGQTQEDPGRNVRKIRFKLGDKKGSLELLARYHKLLTDRLELTGKNGGPVTLRTLDKVLDDQDGDGDGNEPSSES